MSKDLQNLELETINIEPSTLTVVETLDIVQSTINGISSKEAKKRLVEYGENKLPEKNKQSKISIFISNFKSPLVYALFAAAIFALILGKLVDVAVILVVVIINAAIGYIQEVKARKDIEALKKMASFSVKVVRGGETSEIDASLLVPGDIVILEEGVRIPADGRVIEANNVLINESSLTGESELVLKTSEKTLLSSNITSKNMVFQGTMVGEGNGKFVVLSTGADTKFGKIAIFAQDTESVTPIQKKIEKFSKQIGIAVLVISVLVLVFGLLNGNDLIEMFQLAISLAVSAIPEGLPIAVTIVLVLGAKRMAKRKAIVRNMMAVETLGTTTVIATDKTGTLTHNKLKVVTVYADNDYVFEPGPEVGSGYYTFQGKKVSGTELENILIAGSVCNDAEYNKSDDKIIGEPTDVAILENARICGVDKAKYPRLDERPFSSNTRYMAVLTERGSKKIIYLKGAPEEVIKRIKLTTKEREDLTRKVEEMSKEGLRVVALAEKTFAGNFAGSLQGGFRLLGFIGMKDTYRPGIKEAINKCKEAGIRIVMLTGDHVNTAAAIAMKLGIIHKETEAVVAQDYFSNSRGKNLDLNRVSVFARILPEIKYRVIDELRTSGEIVAMTGDGVNDVPALRKADISIAMGLSGTDAAKEAADLVLADDNFATIVAAVEEGRTIFANLRKTILYLISTSLGEVLTVLGSLLMGLPLPITALQILWINLITDTSATIPLGMEPKEADHLKVPPRNPKEGIVSGLMARRALLVGLYMAVVGLFIFKTNLAVGMEYARTMTFLFLSVSQWFNALNCRSEKKSVFLMNPFSNPALLLGIALGLVAQVAVMYLPLFESVFGFVPVGINAWATTAVASFGLILLIELDKLLSLIILKVLKK
ncbi:MAG: HAD-IC family P-type ATPase [Patescibacteria group bacterium]